MYPDRLRCISSPPKQLYVLGDETLLNGMNLAIIGSRNCTEYGERQANIFAKELSIGGLNIVSGMALGIDSIAHKACLEAGGKTIAVLGSGFNHIYPKENEKLFFKILDSGGAIISEYGPNTEVDSRHFPARNRIVSGISLGILVVEAAYRSGTSITANFAKRQKKDIFCIPSSIDNNKGVGTARLIDKGAKIALKPQDILQKYKLDGKNVASEVLTNKNKIDVPEIYQEIYKYIDINGSYINDIAKKSKIPIYEISQKLFMMELEGYIEKRYGDFYVPKT